MDKIHVLLNIVWQGCFLLLILHRFIFLFKTSAGKLVGFKDKNHCHHSVNVIKISDHFKQFTFYE